MSCWHFLLTCRIQKQLVKDKVVEYNCAATKIFLPFLLQIPLWISVSMALRRMAGTLNLDTTHDALVLLPTT